MVPSTACRLQEVLLLTFLRITDCLFLPRLFYFQSFSSKTPDIPPGLNHRLPIISSHATASNPLDQRCVFKSSLRHEDNLYSDDSSIRCVQASEDPEYMEAELFNGATPLSGSGKPSP
ncbi:hypothetical protein CPB83DRAFT_284234 [Crepidotus variabilis]|uniref:Uncharacterized protein n=1 Tax=Crepidotus variabilis TaxID=179855 RepID=A0A9P6JQE5_9AGAR|nr:hypothetical protein CPB83DRAFT_284234 [Crepidotus variabilis]